MLNKQNSLRCSHFLKISLLPIVDISYNRHNQRWYTLFKPVYFWQREHEIFVVLANFVYFVAKFRIFGVLYTG